MSVLLKLNHKKLKVWEKSIGLVTEIYALTGSFPFDEKFGLTSQLRRASVSIPSNIAEGAARKSAKERKRFYEIARSSLVEVDTQLEISISLNYLTQKEIQKVGRFTNEIFAMLTAMV